MARFSKHLLQCSAALLGGAIILTASAAPPDHAGGPNKAKAEKHADKGASRQGGGSGINIDIFFDSRHRDILRDYYRDEFSRQGCPPGLAKKHNGCQPPGQAKKWRVGHALPGDLIYYDLPRDLQRRLGYDDPAYKLIRVGADILRIGVGSAIVVEAVEDLGGAF